MRLFRFIAFSSPFVLLLCGIPVALFAQSGVAAHEQQLAVPLVIVNLNAPARMPYVSQAQTAPAPSPYLDVLEGIGLRMSLDTVRAAAKAAGSLRGPVKQGPTTYNLRTKDLMFQIELGSDGKVYQYNVSAVNVRHLPNTDSSGTLYDHLVKAFGPRSSWDKSVLYDIGEGGEAYAIVSDPAHFQ